MLATASAISKPADREERYGPDQGRAASQTNLQKEPRSYSGV
jgi:hypothetical protein